MPEISSLMPADSSRSIDRVPHFSACPTLSPLAGVVKGQLAGHVYIGIQWNNRLDRMDDYLKQLQPREVP
jgi:hypothetical protein